jgi:succinate-semialdehyde dehydrogenase/glutarate-semialdehyde dehydrogenase
VVFGDADPEKTADTISAFKYRNAGQVCISPTRFYVQENVYDRFLKRFTDNAKAIKLGDGLEKDTTMGPLANARRLDAMDSFVTDAKNRGGKIQTGGNRSGNQGFFFEPTVITDIPDDSKIMTEEPFGPLAPIVTFKTFDEVVERANSLEFGLAAYTFTSSPKTATAIGDALQSGMVGVNSVAISTPETPFDGVKESGHGSEGGTEGLSAYLNTKFISQGRRTLQPSCAGFVRASILFTRRWIDGPSRQWRLTFAPPLGRPARFFPASLACRDALRRHLEWHRRWRS